MGWPGAEIAVTPSLVRSLLAEQHPQLAELVLREVGFAFDNAMWRVGEGLAARLPRREVAASLMMNELTYLPVLASRRTLPTLGSPSIEAARARPFHGCRGSTVTCTRPT